MGYKLRYIPGESLVEVTCRVIHRRFLLRPSESLNRAVIGALARGQQRYGMKICAFVYLSNHCHLLLRPRDAQQLADFMRYVNSKIAKEAGRLHHWREKFWGRRYTDIVVSHEPEAQLRRLRYILEQGSKERLVASPRHWPGANSTRALAGGDRPEGHWIDRSEQYRARQRGEPAPDARFATRERVELSPLPCWEGLSASQRETKIRLIVREIEEAMVGVAVFGRKAILEQNPHDRPETPDRRSPAPRFHAVLPRVRRALEWAYRLFMVQHRQASEDLKLGKAHVAFPRGCFPGPGRFVPL